MAIKLSSIEWLEKELEDKLTLYTDEWSVINDIINQAKEMHKQEIIDAWEKGFYTFDFEDNGKNYYNETFKK